MRRVRKKKHSQPYKVIALVDLLLLAAMSVGFAISHDEKPQHEIRYDYTVKEGDTLWDLGKENIGEEEDVRDWIRKVQDINGININEEPLYAGQKLVIYRH